MLVQFGNNWIQKIPLTAKLDSACGLVQFWLSSEFFSSNYFQIGQHVVLLHIRIVLSALGPITITNFKLKKEQESSFLEELNAANVCDCKQRISRLHVVMKKGLKFSVEISAFERRSMSRIMSAFAG